MQKYLFIRYINNQCTSEELDEVIKWFEDGADKNLVDNHTFLKQIWNRTDIMEETNLVDYDRILDKVHHNLNIAHYGNTYKISKRKKPLSKIIRFLTSAAAILSIPLLALSIYTYILDSHPIPGFADRNPVYTKIVSPYGSTLFTELPDGSKVWLNRGSSLTFPQHCSGSTRKVELLGEGYFQVAHNSKKPFIVKTGDFQVTAFGTEFDLMAYPDDQIIEATLKSGKIILQKVSPTGKIFKLFEMKPNQHISYNEKENKLKYSDVDPDIYISWIEGKLIFRDEPIDVVIKKLSRWYNVDIEANDPELSNFNYTATFVNESLSQVLDLLKIATPITYTMSARTRQEDDTFSKREVVISYAKKSN